MCRVWCGRDGWSTLALVIDCHTRELLGWHLSRSGRSKTAESALEQALIARYGHLGRVDRPFLLRSDNGLVFTSRSYTRLGEELWAEPGVHHPILPGAERDGRARHPNVEGPMRPSPSIREPAACRARVIGDWIHFYNHRRPHQALAMRTPAEAYALAA
jgi:putative transposase